MSSRAHLFWPVVLIFFVNDPFKYLDPSIYRFFHLDVEANSPVQYGAARNKVQDGAAHNKVQDGGN